MKKEIGVKVLPDRFFGHSKGGQRVREAASKMGIEFVAQEKFINPDKCKIGCDWCMLGCPKNARWTTREYVKDAVAYGAELLHSSRVEKLIFADNKSKVLGIKLADGSIIRGDNVILSAGGIGSPALLLRSDIKHLGTQDIGTRFFMDPMNILLGYSKDSDGGMWREQSFSHAIESFADEGFMIGNAAALGTWLVMSIPFARLNTALQNWYKAPIVKRGMGLFVKMSDDPHGQIFYNEKTSKPFTQDDSRRMDKGTSIAKEILVNAGAKQSSISVLKWAGGHPGGTIAMNKSVEKDFSTEIQGLYVCDGSVMPVSPGAPPSLSICAMSMLLGKILTGQVKVEERLINAKNKTTKK
jgi:ferredoxin